MSIGTILRMYNMCALSRLARQSHGVQQRPPKAGAGCRACHCTRFFDRQPLSIACPLHMALSPQPFEVARLWASAVTEEFYTQGDMEKERGFDILPMFDRQKADLAKGQIGFIDFLAAHQFNAMVDWYPDFQWTKDGYQKTRGVWQVPVLRGAAPGLCLKGRVPSGQSRGGCRAVTGGVKAVGGRFLAVGNAMGGWCWGMGTPLG